MSPDKIFVIAEAGINHDGQLEKALEMVSEAKKAGADAIKFQTFKADEFCSDDREYTYISQGETITEPMIDMFKRYEFCEEDWVLIKKEASRVGIEFFSTPQNLSDLQLLLKVGIGRIKVGSDDLTNLNLIKAYASYGLPIILSTGMSTISEIDDAISAAGWHSGAEVTVMVCTSEYPSPLESINVSRVTTLKNAFPGLRVGFSDHTESNISSIMASALGAEVFEKHFTLDKGSSGPDHRFSLNPAELKSWVSDLRNSLIAKGTGVFYPTTQEQKMKELARRSVVANTDIYPNEILTTDNLALKRPGTGIPPKFIDSIIGKKTKYHIKKDSQISWEFLT